MNIMIDSNKPIIRFKNVKLIKNGRLVVDDLWIQDDIIINPEPLFFEQQKEADIVVDCQRAIIAPGYIDLQINGGFGYDFSTPEIDINQALNVVGTNLVRYGVTSFCPTLITQPSSNYRMLLPRMKRGPIIGGANILGIHVEGPFINPEKKGAHPERYIQNEINSIEQIEQYYHDLSNVSIMTIAPELDRNNVCKQLVCKGIVVSLGHSNACLDDSENAFRNGASMITHLFNAMPLFHHRDPGLLGLLTIDSERQMYYGIIADGIHTHYSALRLAFYANRTGMVLVSDAISAAGLETGLHKIGCEMIEIKNDHAYLAGTNTLCGSIATLDHCVRYLQSKVPDCSIVDAIECATLHPARVLGIEHRKGTLEFGADADFIILNDQLEILSTFVAGKCVFIDSERMKQMKIEINKVFCT
ncbi:N-acetylglucosamine-6-phosphate deacetylase [Dermatophagoides pteronyssinus]|uniref:N-acetylglucosamine-6-phosphate deacetylase n=1 Tax=Dermatophagoides pteronyssinus TaxID=6956 RepID=A0A6P6Y2W1_DERPT|nr:N-acetylglucosamine-6-phosphate deacetylase-like [Dermatophagoides pteronyssinus]